MDQHFDAYIKGFEGFGRSFNRGVLVNDESLHRDYQDALDHGEGKCNRLRTIIVGDKGVGKTSLLQMLTGDRCDPTVEPNSTEGIDISICETSDLSPEWTESSSGSFRSDDPALSAAWCVCNNQDAFKGAFKNVDNGDGVNQTSRKRRGGLRNRYENTIPVNVNTIRVVDKMKAASRILGMQLKWTMILITLAAVKWLDFVGGGFGPFAWTAVLSLRLFLDMNTAYRFGTVCSLQVMLVYIVYDVMIQDNECGWNYETFSGLLLVVVCCFISGLIGFLSGLGSRTGMAVAFCLLSNPKYNTRDEFENWYQSTPYILLLCTGHLLGIVLVRQAGDFNKTAIRRLAPKKTILIIVTSVLLMQVVFWTSKPVWCCLTLVSVGCAMGIFVTKGSLYGREYGAGEVIRDAYLLKKGIGFISAVAFGHLIGWEVSTSIRWSQWVSAIMFILRDVYVFCQVHKLHQVGIPIDIFRDQLLTASQGLDATVIKLVVWDFAGDSIYKFMQHFFLSRKAVFILAFNLEHACENLNQQIEQLRKWLFTIKAHSDTFNALVFVVGTHLDSVKHHEGFIDLVAKEFQEKLYTDFCSIFAINAENDSPLFVVENSRHIDKDGVLLREAIKRLSKGRPFLKQKQPVAYLRFIQHIKKLQNERNNPWFIKCDVLLEELERNGFDEEECQTFLRFGHLTGEFIYRDDDDVMQQYVILEPQHFLDVMNELLKFPPLSDRQLENAEKWQTLKTKGVASVDLLAEIIDEDDELVATTVRFLEAYNMLLPIGPTDGVGFERCIVPSHLPDHNPDECWDSAPDDEDYYFDFGYVPSEAIFYRLLARCWYHHQSEARTNGKLFWQMWDLLLQRRCNFLHARVTDEVYQATDYQSSCTEPCWSSALRSSSTSDGWLVN